MNEITIINSKKPRNPLITMAEMKPLQVARIKSGCLSKDEGTIIMRTASLDSFEIMDMTNPGADQYWAVKHESIMVEPTPNATITINLNE